LGLIRRCAISLTRIFGESSPRRYIVFGGKGGCGKTTLAAASAYHLARQGKRVLVFSADPQASLSDIFQKEIFGKGATEIMPNLYAEEIDAGRRLKGYQQEIRQKILDIHGMEKIPDEIEEYIRGAEGTPAMEETAAFDAVADIIAEDGYDYYVYDLAPFGQALYYLTMASAYNAWIDKIIGFREQMREYEKVAALMRREKEMGEDAILNELKYIKERINRSSAIFLDKEKTAFFLVVCAEEVVIEETKRASELFAKFDVPLSGYIVNCVLPDSLKEEEIPAYLKGRLAMQEGCLRKIEEEFAGKVIASVPEMAGNVTGLAMIEGLAAAMF